jgi:hypothetical protein
MGVHFTCTIRTAEMGVFIKLVSAYVVACGYSSRLYDRFVVVCAKRLFPRALEIKEMLTSNGITYDSAQLPAF